MGGQGKVDLKRESKLRVIHMELLTRGIKKRMEFFFRPLLLFCIKRGDSYLCNHPLGICKIIECCNRYVRSGVTLFISQCTLLIFCRTIDLFIGVDRWWWCAEIEVVIFRNFMERSLGIMRSLFLHK